ncbi:amidohydrolase [Truncatella angustata]|uniref:Amidohydrolase n=1 Tax=Truncatella angustata TaxID=152316 RepID=A0A9P8UA55_9PEZI|nr:amidohydrolase [Truncatella angustata]KAH6639917.1 amidohydrolase [Truncatella angustata]
MDATSDDISLEKQLDADPEKLIKPWKLPPRKSYVFTNATVVDPVAGSLIRNAWVKISDGLIVYVKYSHGPSPLVEVEVEEGSTIIDCTGLYLCPGLIDAHVHLTAVPGSASLDGSMGDDAAVSHFRQPYVASQSLKRGFTSLRDCGGATLALKEAIADNVFPGPRLFIANRALSQTGGHGDRRGPHNKSAPSCCGGLSVVVDGVDECIRAAREQLRTGADFVKIMVGGGVASPSDRLSNTQFTSAEIRAIVEVAESYGTFVTAHAYTPRAIRHAVSAGVRGIEHGNLVDADAARLMAERGVWLTPTLVTYEAMADADKYAGFLPPENAAKNREVLEKGLESLRIARDAGVKMCYGSDLLGPLTAEQSGEFAIRRRALGNVEVLRAATVNPAEMLGQEEFLGQIRDGFAADLLVLNVDPLEDITVLATPQKHLLAVVKDGRVWESRWRALPVDVREPSDWIQ